MQVALLESAPSTRRTAEVMCPAFAIETHGRDTKREKRLTEEAHEQNKRGKMLAPMVGGAHLVKVDALRRLRLVFEDSPKTRNLVELASPSCSQRDAQPGRPRTRPRRLRAQRLHARGARPRGALGEGYFGEWNLCV